jgi:hypothetical protein
VKERQEVWEGLGEAVTAAVMCRHSARTLGEIIRCWTNRKMVMCCDQDVPRGCGCVHGAAVVGLAVHGACIGFAVVGLAVHGAAVVGLAVVGFAVHGAAVAVRGNNRTRRVATQGSVAHQTKLVRVNRCCSLKSTDQTPVNAHSTLRSQKLVTINLTQSCYAQ